MANTPMSEAEWKAAVFLYLLMLLGRSGGVYLDVENTDLLSEDLSGSTVPDADLRFSDFSGSNLSSCNLMGVDIRNTDFTNCNLDNSNFKGANTNGSTNFTGSSQVGMTQP